MKFTIQSFFVVAIGLIALDLYAQTPSTITGQVTDQLGKTLPNTGLFVLQAQDSSLVSLGISGQGGHFKIASIKPGLYLLRYTLDGYYTVYSDPIRISQGRSLVELGIQKLKPKKTQPLAKPQAVRRARA